MARSLFKIVFIYKYIKEQKSTELYNLIIPNQQISLHTLF